MKVKASDLTRCMVEVDLMLGVRWGGHGGRGWVPWRVVGLGRRRIGGSPAIPACLAAIGAGLWSIPIWKATHECLPTLLRLLQAIVVKVGSLSTHTFGCRLVQRVLQHCSIAELKEVRDGGGEEEGGGAGHG